MCAPACVRSHATGPAKALWPLGSPQVCPTPNTPPSPPTKCTSLHKWCFYSGFQNQGLLHGKANRWVRGTNRDVSSPAAGTQVAQQPHPLPGKPADHMEGAPATPPPATLQPRATLPNLQSTRSDQGAFRVKVCWAASRFWVLGGWQWTALTWNELEGRQRETWLRAFCLTSAGAPPHSRAASHPCWAVHTGQLGSPARWLTAFPWFQTCPRDPLEQDNHLGTGKGCRLSNQLSTRS